MTYPTMSRMEMSPKETPNPMAVRDFDVIPAGPAMYDRLDEEGWMLVVEPKET
jgi:hypothetical protein